MATWKEFYRRSLIPNVRVKLSKAHRNAQTIVGRWGIRPASNALCQDIARRCECFGGGKFPGYLPYHTIIKNSFASTYGHVAAEGGCCGVCSQHPHPQQEKLRAPQMGQQLCICPDNKTEATEKDLKVSLSGSTSAFAPTKIQYFSAGGGKQLASRALAGGTREVSCPSCPAPVPGMHLAGGGAGEEWRYCVLASHFEEETEDSSQSL